MSGTNMAEWITKGIGCSAGLIQIILNYKILREFMFRSSLKNKVEFQLIFFRTILDFTNGCINTSYYFLTIPSMIYPDFISFDYLFFIVLLSSNILETRSFLAAGIAFERALATYMPINFYKYRSYISNVAIIILFSSLGAFCDVVLFGICDFSLPVNPKCSTFVCATPLCYQNYAMYTKTVYCSINFSFSILLCVKLMLMTYTKTTVTKDLKKANILSLTDGVSSLTFELLPTLFFNYGVIDIKDLGPITGVLRTVSRAFEAIVMYSLMNKHHIVVQPSISITSRKEIVS